MESPKVAGRMKELFPNAKVVFLLRHPVERAISNYRFSKQHGLETESIEHAVAHKSARAESQRAQMSVDPFAYVARGHYARYLKPFFRVFPRREIKVLLLDDLRAETGDTLADLFQFVGVDSSFRPDSANQHFNQTPPDDLRLSAEFVNELLEIYRPSNRALEQLLGCDLGRWDRPSDSLRSIMDAG
jgi:hypothetical protein